MTSTETRETVTVNNIEYGVEKSGDTYTLHGKRGACYGLIRARNQDMMFAVNLRGFGVVERLGWFTDEGSKLRPCVAL